MVEGRWRDIGRATPLIRIYGCCCCCGTAATYRVCARTKMLLAIIAYAMALHFAWGLCGGLRAQCELHPYLTYPICTLKVRLMRQANVYAIRISKFTAYELTLVARERYERT